MIPAQNDFIEKDFEIETQPTHTYQMKLETNRIQGYTDGISAMEQAVFKILSTERYQYLIYSWNYGIELQDLFGEPVSYVCPELERRITEALLWDDRIQGVDNFAFDISEKGVVRTRFIVYTIFGNIPAEKEVRI